MADRFTWAARLLSRLRTALLICAVALGFILALGATVFSAGPPWVMDSDGVLMPDLGGTPPPKTQPTPTPTPYVRGNASQPMAVERKQTGAMQAGATVSYTVTKTGPKTYTFRRNGQPWITVTGMPGSIQVSDPNGTQAGVVTIKTRH